MGIAQTVRELTIDEYLLKEAKSEVKHEYVNGLIYAMVGASRKHNLLAGAVYTALRSHLKGSGCRVYVSDMKLHIKSTDSERFYYPDVMVSCDSSPPSEYYENNPVLLVEVLSVNTESKDRLEKLAAYMAIPSLKEYLLISQDNALVDVYRRVGNNWIFNSYEDGETILPDSVNLELPVRDIYEDIIGQIL